MPEVLWPQFLGGLAVCLFGWTFYWGALHLAGGVLGAGLGLSLAWLGATLLSNLEGGPFLCIVGLGGVLGFFAGIIFMRGLHRFLFFFLGACLGMALGHGLFVWGRDGVDLFKANPDLWQPVVVIVCTVLLGIGMVFGSRWIVILLTALTGSLLAAMAVHHDAGMLLFPPLAIGSFFLQTGLLRRFMPPPADDEDEE